MRFSGLRRIQWVSVTVEHGHAVAEVHGLGHHSPRSVRISLRDASELAAQGLPTVIRRGPAEPVEA